MSAAVIFDSVDAVSKGSYEARSKKVSVLGLYQDREKRTAVLYLALETMTATLNLRFCLSNPGTTYLLIGVLLIARRRLVVVETDAGHKEERKVRKCKLTTLRTATNK